MKNRYITGILEKNKNMYEDSEIIFKLKTELYSEFLEDYISEITIPIEKAAKMIKWDIINNVFKGEKPKIRILMKKLFDKEEIKKLKLEFV